MAYPLTYLYLAAFASMLVMTTLIAVVMPPSRHKAHGVLLFGLVTLWCLADLLSNLAISGEQVRLLAFLFAPVWAITSPLVVDGIALYTGWPRLLRRPTVRVLVFVPALGSVALVWSGRLYHEFLPASANGYFFQSRSTGWQVPVNTYQGCCVVTAALLLLIAARRQQESRYLVSGRVMAQVMVPVGILGCLANGGLSPQGVDLPFAASVLLSGALLTTGVGILRRDYFVPADGLRRERDLARDQLSRREQVLSAMPLGVAIVAQARTRLLYRNATFDALLRLDDDAVLPRALEARLTTTSLEQLAAGVELPWPTGDPGALALLLNMQPVTYADQPARLITLRDVSAHKRVEAELEDKRAQLLHAQKMEAVGRLSVGIAHDFNNQLTAILGNAVAVADHLGPAHPAAGDLTDIQRAAERASVLTRQLLSFGRKQEARAQDLELNNVLGEIRRLFSRLLGPKIALEVQPSTEPAWLRMDRVQLEQVLMTLVVNAHDAMPGGGRLRVAVQPEGERVALEVQDSGVGMSPEVQARCCEPFFSTKGELGTGIGLATAQALVTQAGGEIAVCSTPGQGTTFTLRFPRAAPARFPSPAQPAAPTTEPPAHGRTVLLVEDDEAVRRTVARMLEQEGFVVQQTDCAERALDLVGEDARGVEVLLTDLALPGLDGQQLGRALRARRPGLPVIIMTGHRLDQASLAGDATGFLTKPFRPEALRAVLRRALDAAPAQQARVVLVVEDEPALRRLLVRSFEEAGWVVREAGGLRDALAQLERGPLHAVVTDLGLDDGTGYEVLQAARARQPGVACLVTSGGGTVDRAREPDLAGVVHLAKPYAPEQVLLALQRCACDDASDGAPHDQRA